MSPNETAAIRPILTSIPYRDGVPFRPPTGPRMPSRAWAASLPGGDFWLAARPVVDSGPLHVLSGPGIYLDFLTRLDEQRCLDRNPSLQRD